MTARIVVVALAVALGVLGVPAVASAASAAIVIDTPLGTTLDEADLGQTQVVVVTLATMPTDDVDVHALVDGQLGTWLPMVTFTPATWNVPQSIVVTAIDDDVDESSPHAGLLELAAASNDGDYASLPSSYTSFAITDDDAADVLAAPAELQVAEGGATGTFDVVLATRPTDDVTVSVAPTTGVSVDLATLTFTAADWDTPQVVVATAVDDAVEEYDPHDASIGLSVDSDDSVYDAFTVDAIDVEVDDDDGARTAGAAFSAFVEGANPNGQHAAGSTMWFNPAESGSFTVRAVGSASAAIEKLDFAAPVAGGWSGGGLDFGATAGLYDTTYAWTTGAAAPGAVAIVTRSTSGVVSAPATFTIAADATPPSGTTLNAQSAVTRDTSAPLSAAAGTDGQSGIGSWIFGRQVAPLAADVCGAYGAWTTVGPASPAGGISDAALASGTCVRYRVVVTDRVGNAESVVQVGELKVDRTAPIATIDVPASTVVGSITLTGVASDSTTRVRSVSVVVEDRYSICSNATVDPSGRWSCTWSVGPTELGPATIKVTATDAAGQRTSSSLPVMVTAPPNPFGPREEDIDVTPPVVGLARMPLISWSDKVTVKASAYDDRNGDIEVRVEQQSASVASTTFSPWSPSFEESDFVTLEDRGETTCFRGVAVDEAGNRTVSAARCTTLPLDDVDLVGDDRWDDVTAKQAWLSSLRRATVRGATLSVRTSDATPILVVNRCRGCGAIRVFHGKRVLGTYSLASPKTRFRQLIALPKLTRAANAPIRIVTTSARPVFIDGVIAAP